MKKGKFFVFEGGEGVGKSTHIAWLKKDLEDKNYKIELVREPGGTEISEKIRSILLDPGNTDLSDTTELLLYLSARSQLVHQIIKPSLEQGKVVLADRFYHSTFVYQGIVRGLGLDKVMQGNEVAIQGIKPDYTFILDVPTEIGLERAGKVTGVCGDRLENEGLYFHKKVRQGYLSLPDLLNENIKIVDANRDAKVIYEEIKQEIYSLLIK